MAELTISADEVVGIKKEIEEGSLELIFNALQSDIYSFPIKSFIRETISNGLDSIIEKNVFKAIEGGDPVEKYFLQRQDNMLLKDSEYDPNYYNSQHLSDNETVLVTYIEGNPRDKVIIKDYGVGLGGKRLRGYFKIGWSSKRNFLTARGLYGLGSKSALATGVEFYTMTTVYNGYKTTFMIYNRDYENITMNTPTGKTEIWEVTMANNAVINKEIFWEKTHEKNSVTIEVEVKKHNKQTYISATKDQFQYFNGKVNIVVQENGIEKLDKLDETPEFESDNLLIPKYSTYSSPHILVDGISYGLVSWNELELEDRKGKIAIKVTANEVDITQSRESLKWTDKTKSTILKAIRRAEDEASEFISSKVTLENQENIFELVSSYRNISGQNDVNSVVSTFSKFLQIHNIRPTYSFTIPRTPSEFDPSTEQIISARLNDDLFSFLFYGHDIKKVYTYAEGGKLKIGTATLNSFDGLQGIIIYADEASLGPKLANHLLSKYNVTSLIYIRENNTRIKDYISINSFSKDYKTSVIKQYAEGIIKKYCTLNLDEYDVVYDETIEELDNSVLENTADNLAKIRKMNKEIMWYTYSYDYSSTSNIYNVNEKSFIRTKVSEKIAKLDTYIDGKEVVIVPAAYTALGKMLLIMEALKPSKIPFVCVFVAEENIKYFEELNCTHIKNYFRQVNTKTGELMIGQKLVDINTAYQFHKIKQKFSLFSSNVNIISRLSTIDQKKYSSFTYYNGGYDIKETFKRAIHNTAVLDDIFNYLDVLSEFQAIVNTKDKDTIAAKAKELFNSEEIYNVYAYDKDYIDSIEEELTRLSSIGPLLEHLEHCSEECIPLLQELLKIINNKS